MGDPETKGSKALKHEGMFKSNGSSAERLNKMRAIGKAFLKIWHLSYDLNNENTKI